MGVWNLNAEFRSWVSQSFVFLAGVSGGKAAQGEAGAAIDEGGSQQVVVDEVEAGAQLGFEGQGAPSPPPRAFSGL